VGLLPFAGAWAQDDHGDTSATASLLPIGTSRPGRIEGASDRDVFRLDLLGRAQIEVRTSGQTDTQGELLDSAGTRVMSDDDSGPGDNFSITADLDAGVYYVEVEGDSGAYAINARLGSASDHGDTVESSTLLKLHTREELSEVSPQVLLATAGRIWPSTDDTDVFRIDVPTDATRVTLRTSGSVDTWASLADSSATEIAFDDGDGNFRIEETLDAGIYYLMVNGHGIGAYRALGVMAPGEDDGDDDDGAETTRIPPAPTVTAIDATTIRAVWSRDYRAGESDVFDHQVRERGGSWRIDCRDYGGGSSGTYEYRWTVSGVEPDTTYDVRYRHRPSGSCSSGAAGAWSGIGSARTPADGGGSDSYCRDGDTVDPGAGCDIYDTRVAFDVSASGTGCLRSGGFTSCSGRSQTWRNATINGETITFVAERNDDDAWTVEDVEPEPSDDAAGMAHSKSAAVGIDE